MLSVRRGGGVFKLMVVVHDIYFLIPFYLQAVHVYLANGVNLKKGGEEECSVAHLQIQQVQGLVCPYGARLTSYILRTKDFLQATP
jgi:hypothetical protein